MLNQMHQNAELHNIMHHATLSRSGQTFQLGFNIMMYVHCLYHNFVVSHCSRPVALEIMGNRVATLEFQLRAWSPSNP